MPQLKTLKDIDLKNKTVLYRAPYDIGLIDIKGQLEVEDESRIKATLPTLQYLLQNQCKIVILTWVKRPTGFDLKLSTKPHAQKLSQLLGQPVSHVEDSIGPKVVYAINTLHQGQILMLENVRFYQGEFDDNDQFAKELTEGSDLIVFDAFPQAHRKHASTTGILRHLPAVAGLYFENEYNALSHILDKPKRPFTVVIGGAKVSDKIEAVKNLLNIADIILIGGGLANAFLKSQCKEMGSSYIEDVFVDTAKGEKKDWVMYARQILEQSENIRIGPISESDSTEQNKGVQADQINNTDAVQNESKETDQDKITDIDQDKPNFKISSDMPITKIMLPYDLVAGKSIDDDTKTQLVVAYEQTKVIPDNYGAYDIGPLTAKIYGEIIAQSGTVFWAGPMGVIEKPNYANGTRKIVEAINDCSRDNLGQLTIAAGGDTIAALNKLGNPKLISHISLAGGATLEFLAGNEFPVLPSLLKG